MKKRLFIILLFIALSGCTQIGGEQGLQELQEIELRYLGRGTIGPSKIEDIDLMEKELAALKTKGSQEITEMIDIRVDLLEFTRGYLDAEKSIRKISLVKGGCSEGDPLNQSIDKLGTILERVPGIRARINRFETENAALRARSNISLEDFEKFAETLQNRKQEFQDFYNQACIIK